MLMIHHQFSAVSNTYRRLWDTVIAQFIMTSVTLVQVRRNHLMQSYIEGPVTSMLAMCISAIHRRQW